MKLSNFKLERTEGKYALRKTYYATVDVETGFLFWKKKERKQICKSFGAYWFFVDTGVLTPDRQVERLARAWSAQTGQEV